MFQGAVYVIIVPSGGTLQHNPVWFFIIVLSIRTRLRFASHSPGTLRRQQQQQHPITGK